MIAAMLLCVFLSQHSGEDRDDVSGERAQFQQPAGSLSSRGRATPGEPEQN